jgi:hypothetical protein
VSPQPIWPPRTGKNTVRALPPFIVAASVSSFALLLDVDRCFAPLGNIITPNSMAKQRIDNLYAIILMRFVVSPTSAALRPPYAHAPQQEIAT